ncbi:hypothetical protein [Sporosarcina sp. P33]|uniref:hypothetical protein n=1 Tax=Sporosarcina sp. P33 TaxID=1930764 RepID=UPI0012DF439E|nr:hypothetical protein [Sporosarcina sp. P33]
MGKDDRKEIVKTNEMRTKEISKMIGEGGMGADKYYNIKKVPPAEKIIEVPEDNNSKD